jgi:hypothetical protein
MNAMMGYHYHLVYMQRAPQKQKFALQGHSCTPKMVSSPYIINIPSSLIQGLCSLIFSHNTQILGHFPKQIPI